MQHCVLKVFMQNSSLLCVFSTPPAQPRTQQSAIRSIQTSIQTQSHTHTQTYCIHHNQVVSTTARRATYRPRPWQSLLPAGSGASGVPSESACCRARRTHPAPSRSHRRSGGRPGTPRSRVSAGPLLCENAVAAARPVWRSMVRVWPSCSPCGLLPRGSGRFRKWWGLVWVGCRSDLL